MSIPAENMFERPVTIADALGIMEIASASDVLDYLAGAEWPNGEDLEEARLVAEAVIDGRLTVVEARERFIEAAERAGVSVFP